MKLRIPCGNAPLIRCANPKYNKLMKISQPQEIPHKLKNPALASKFIVFLSTNKISGPGVRALTSPTKKRVASYTIKVSITPIKNKGSF